MTAVAGDHAPGSPLITVALATYNRADRALDAVRTLLAQDGADFEVVAVDDGSTDDTSARLAEIDDPRLRVVTRPNGGISAARNSGAAAAQGRYLVFVDDDDRPLDGWLAGLARLTGDGVGVVSCGAEFYNERGWFVTIDRPGSAIRALGPDPVLFLAGTFLVRRDVFDDVGGYTVGLQASHQTDLGLRVTRHCREHGLAVRSTDEVLFHIEHRGFVDRPEASPAKLLSAAEHMLTTHADALAGDPVYRADTHGVAGVAAWRLGDRARSRRHLLAAARARPSLGTIGRVAVAWTPLAARLWDLPATPPPSGPGPSASQAVEGGEDGPEPSVVAPQEQDDAGSIGRFLPEGYEEREPARDGDPSEDDAAYRLAGRIAAGRRPSRVLELRCGDGGALVRHVAPFATAIAGVDEGDTIDAARAAHPDRQWIEADLDRCRWPELEALAPDLVLCFDQLHRVARPDRLLAALRGLVAGGGLVLLTTPDRDRVVPARPVGPPADAAARRHWSEPEVRELVSAHGLRVVDVTRPAPNAAVLFVLEHDGSGSTASSPLAALTGTGSLRARVRPWLRLARQRARALGRARRGSSPS